MPTEHSDFQDGMPWNAPMFGHHMQGPLLFHQECINGRVFNQPTSVCNSPAGASRVIDTFMSKLVRLNSADSYYFGSFWYPKRVPSFANQRCQWHGRTYTGVHKHGGPTSVDIKEPPAQVDSQAGWPATAKWKFYEVLGQRNRDLRIFEGSHLFTFVPAETCRNWEVPGKLSEFAWKNEAKTPRLLPWGETTMTKNGTQSDGTVEDKAANCWRGSRTPRERDHLAINLNFFLFCTYVPGSKDMCKYVYACERMYIVYVYIVCILYVYICIDESILRDGH